MIYCQHAGSFQIRICPVFFFFLHVSLYYLHMRYFPRRQDIMAFHRDISLSACGGGEKAENEPLSTALDLLLWTDQSAAADGQIFCCIYISVACQSSHLTADSSLPIAADRQACSPVSSPHCEWQLMYRDIKGWTEIDWNIRQKTTGDVQKIAHWRKVSKIQSSEMDHCY